MRILHFGLAILGICGVSSPTLAADRDGNPQGAGPIRGSRPAEPAAPFARAVLTFTDRDEFLSAASGFTENFEREPWTADCDSGGTALMTFFNFEVSSDPPALKLLRDGCFGNHNTTIGGKRYLGADTDSAGASAAVTFLFDRALHVFGTYVVDLDMAPLEITIAGQSYEVPATGDGGEAFFGILASETFSTVTCRIVGEDGDSHYSFDDVTYGTASPGPVDVPAGEPVHWGRIKSIFR